MKYPKEWILKPDKPVPDQIVNFVRSDSPEEHCGLTTYSGTAHTVLPEGKTPVTVESVVIGGVAASKEVYEDPHGLGTMYEWIKFPAGTSVNQIPTYYEIGDDTCSETLDTILSTFRFLE